mgnify:CR=1 FL=1
MLSFFIFLESRKINELVCFDNFILSELEVGECLDRKHSILFTLRIELDKGRVGDAYFKIYAGEDKKLIRITFNSPVKYLYHKNQKGYSDWDISNKIKKALNQFLDQPYSGKDVEGKGLTNWQYAIVLYNYIFYDIPKIKTIKNQIIPGCLSIKLEKPDYTELPNINKQQCKNPVKK